MSKAQIFPLIMICLSFMASAAYAMECDWRHAIYWFSAATLNIAVTF